MSQLDLGKWVRAVAFSTGAGAGQHVVTGGDEKIQMFDLSSDGKLDLAPWRRYKRLVAFTTSTEHSLRSLKEICDGAPSFPHRQAPPWLHGLTALHFAAMFNKLDHARVLLDAGANPLARGRHGETALGCRLA